MRSGVEGDKWGGSEQKRVLAAWHVVSGQDVHRQLLGLPSKYLSSASLKLVLSVAAVRNKVMLFNHDGNS